MRPPHPPPLPLPSPSPRDDNTAPFSQIHCLKKVVTDGRTDGRTDKASYRDAWTHLKRGGLNEWKIWTDKGISMNLKKKKMGFWVNGRFGLI